MGASGAFSAVLNDMANLPQAVTDAEAAAATAVERATVVQGQFDTFNAEVGPGGRLSDEGLSATIAVGTLHDTSGQVGQAVAKLRTGLGMTVVVRGDSTVYGHDTVSADKVAPPATVLPDGSTHTITRSPSPWPSVMGTHLSAVSDSTVTVINQGYSGDWVGRGFDRWTNDVGADLTLYSYGINDASSLSVPADIRGNLSAYVEALEAMVQRDLDWGSAVIFLAPTRQRGQAGTSSGTIIDTYRQALHAVSRKYGIPVIEAESFMTNAKRDAWSDDFHFNTKGNAIIGARMAAALIGGAVLDSSTGRRQMIGGSKAAPRVHDGWVFPATSLGTQSGGYYTPNDSFDGLGIGAKLANGITGTAVIGHLAFYAAEPDLVIFPYYYLQGIAGETGANITLELDFGVEQGDNYHDHVVVPVGRNTQPAPPSSASGAPIVGVGNTYNRDAQRQSTAALRVSTPGWHVLTVKATRSNSSSVVDLLGLEFFSWRDWQGLKSGRGAVFGLNPPDGFSETSPITQAVLPWPELLQSLATPAWTSHHYAAPMLKLTVRTYGVGVVEYALLCTQRPDTAGSDIAARDVDSGGSGEGPVSVFAHKLREFNYTGGTSVPSTNAAGRELQSIAYRASDAAILLNWRTTNSGDGTTAKNMNRAFEYQVSVL